MEEQNFHEETWEHIFFVLTKYKENPELKEFNLIHIYPGELCADPETGEIYGFVDSRFFDAVLFNTITMEKRCLSNKDELDFMGKPIPLRRIRVFADGATLIGFDTTMVVDWETQSTALRKK